MSPPRPGDPRADRLLQRYLTAFAGGEVVLPVPVEDIAEDLLGLRIRPEAGMGGLSGALLPAQRLIRVNADEPPERRRFTVAHEIGHWVVHCADRRERAPIMCRVVARPGADPREREANVFAADLLMPAAAVRRRFTDGGDDPAGLAAAFAVSPEAMGWRLYNLGLVASV